MSLDAALGFAFIAATGALLIGLLFIFFKHSRRRGLRLILGSLSGFFLVAVVAMSTGHQTAKEPASQSHAKPAATLNSGSRNNSTAIGIIDQVEHVKSRREKETGAALSEKATATGENNWARAVERKLGNGCKVSQIEQSTRLICDDIPAVIEQTVFFMTAMSLYELGKWMKATNRWIDGKLYWDAVVNTVDRYGNSAREQAFVISFDADELKKVNFTNIVPAQVMNFARLEKIRAFARPGAAAFCRDEGHWANEFCSKHQERFLPLR